ncbi:MAG: hypothetical protein G8237_09270 [Magnetococcales bacterium]|nr:hypothetical protein [Magnetococcales bacterium]NGZ06534.1 hypothetical protein [Magnetococcales bacterium]
MATVNDLPIPTSGVSRIDALLETAPNLNYLLPDPGNSIRYTFSITENLEDQTPVTALTTTQQDAVRTALGYVARVTGIEFAETASGDNAIFHFSIRDVPNGLAGLCSYNYNYRYDHLNNLTSYLVNEYIYLDDQYLTESIAYGSAGYQVLLHELGHSLGLKHPFEGTNQLADSEDNTSNTLMSYHWSGSAKTTFQEYDLAALAWLYGGDGLGNTYGVGPTRSGMIYTGTAVNDAIQAGTGHDKLYGKGGNDTLRGGEGNDYLSGSTGSDLLYGNAGADRLYGGTGTDTLTGGTGADQFKFTTSSEGRDTITDFSATQGDKLVFVSKNFGNLLTGTLGTSRFRASSSGLASTTSQRFLFNTSTGLLRYDPDGTGANTAVSLATLNVRTLSASQLLIVSS